MDPSNSNPTSLLDYLERAEEREEADGRKPAAETVEASSTEHSTISEDIVESPPQNVHVTRQTLTEYKEAKRKKLEAQRQALADEKKASEDETGDSDSLSSNDQQVKRDNHSSFDKSLDSKRIDYMSISSDDITISSADVSISSEEDSTGDMSEEKDEQPLTPKKPRRRPSIGAGSEHSPRKEKRTPSRGRSFDNRKGTKPTSSFNKRMARRNSDSLDGCHSWHGTRDRGRSARRSRSRNKDTDTELSSSLHRLRVDRESSAQQNRHLDRSSSSKLSKKKRKSGDKARDRSSSKNRSKGKKDFGSSDNERQSPRDDEVTSESIATDTSMKRRSRSTEAKYKKPESNMLGMSRSSHERQMPLKRRSRSNETKYNKAEIDRSGLSRSSHGRQQTFQRQDSGTYRAPDPPSGRESISQEQISPIEQAAQAQRNRDTAFAIKAGYIREYSASHSNARVHGASGGSQHRTNSSDHTRSSEQRSDGAITTAEEDVGNTTVEEEVGNDSKHQDSRERNAPRASAKAGYESSDNESSDSFAFDPDAPGAHEIPSVGGRQSSPRNQSELYDSFRTNQDSYLVSATLVHEDDTEESIAARMLANEKNERLRLLEERQGALEQQIQEQKQLIQSHQNELDKLTSPGEIVQAELIDYEDEEFLNEKIKKSKSIIAEKEAELDSLVKGSGKGLDLLRKGNRKKVGKLIKKLNPFRKSAESLPEDRTSDRMARGSAHSRMMGSYNRREFRSDSETISLSEHSFRRDSLSASVQPQDVSLSHPDGGERALGTEKREDCFIAPEKLPFEEKSISELKKLASDANIDISNCFDRGQIVQQLLDGGLKPQKKNRLNKIFGNTVLRTSRGTSKPVQYPPKAQRKEFRKEIDMPPDDMPVPTITEKRDAVFVPTQSDIFDNFSISQLKKIARDRNVDVSTCTDRSDLVDVLYAAGMRPSGQGKPVGGEDPLSKLSIAELKRLASSKDVDISSCVEKSQIIGALKVAGVERNFERKRPPSSFESYSVAQLKKMALQHQIDVTSCVEKSDIIAILQNAGVGRPSDMSPRLTPGDLKGWRPSQLRLLASHISANSSGSQGETLMITILNVANVERPHLRKSIRSIAALGTAPLAEMRWFANKNEIDMSGCVEMDEILERIIAKCVN